MHNLGNEKDNQTQMEENNFQHQFSDLNTDVEDDCTTTMPSSALSAPSAMDNALSAELSVPSKSNTPVYQSLLEKECKISKMKSKYNHERALLFHKKIAVNPEKYEKQKKYAEKRQRKHKKHHRNRTHRRASREDS